MVDDSIDLSDISLTTSTNIELYEDAPCFSIFTDGHNDPVLTIENDGEVIIHKPEQMGEAAKMFADCVQDEIDKKAGFVEGRRKWEENYVKALMDMAMNGGLTSEQIMDVYNERKVFDILKGVGDGA
jgi:hypothetical protein